MTTVEDTVQNMVRVNAVDFSGYVVEYVEALG